MNMKKYRFAYPDCEHEGDVESAREIVLAAIEKVGCPGHITNSKWSGEDGDYAYVFFEIPEDKFPAVSKAIDDLT